MTPKLQRVMRLDSVPVQEAFYTEEGYLKDKPILTSTGIFEYLNPDGTVRRELRLPEDVFDPESLASYRAKPIVITHDAGLVNKDNVHENQIGTILSEGIKSGDDVRAEIVIHDTDEMKKSGFKELSLGYSLDLDEEPGVWNGRHYDAIQRNIRINHLALVREARAGDQARLNLDGKDGKTLKGGKLMSKVIRKGGQRADEALSPEELQKAIEWYKQNREALNGGDAEEKEAVVEEEKTVEVQPEKAEPEKVASLEEQVGGIRENHPEKPEDEEPFVLPKDEKEEEKKLDAEGVIRDQDKDIKTLLDIIDTLLAERAFDEAEEEVVEKEELKKEENVDADDDELLDDVEVKDPDAEKEEEEKVVIEEQEDGCFEDEEEKKFNADSIDRIIRTRIQLGMIGRQLNLDGLENVSIMTAKKAIIKTVRPKMNLDGKSAAYINAAYDYAVDDVKKGARKGTDYQRKQMFNKDSAIPMKDEESSESARDRMIARQKNKKEEGK